MNSSPVETTNPAGAALFLAAVAGLAADLLLREVFWGVNAFITGLLLFGVILVLRARGTITLPTPAVGLIGVATLCVGSFMWRDSPALNALGLLGCAVCLALAAYRSQGGALSPAGTTQYLLAGVKNAFGIGLGMLPLLFLDVPWRRVSDQPAGSRALRVVRGIVLALPLVLIFAALFASADPVFESMYRNLFNIDMQQVFVHAAVIGVAGWLAGGYARELVVLKRRAEILALPESGGLSFSEIRIVLGAVVFVFLLFDVIQLNVLFGGREFVVTHTNLTYAEYARRGFFDLAIAAALVLPLLLFADWVAPRNENQDREFRALSSVLLGLLGVVLLSALQRMRIYQLSFGLTELRVYTMAFMIWLALVLAWLGATVLRGRRDRFVPGAAILGITMIFVLHVLNPDRLIAEVNLQRAGEGLGFDVSYVTTLSADAAPVIAGALDKVPAPDRCLLARRLLGERHRHAMDDWRAWNIGRSRAFAATEPVAQRLLQWSKDPNCPTVALDD